MNRTRLICAAAAAALSTAGMARAAVTYSGVVLSPIGVPSGFGTAIVASNGTSVPNPQTVVAGAAVGYGTTTSTFKPTHALLWQGAGLAAIDLNPTGSANNVSRAYGIGGSQQVGVFANDPTGRGLFTTSNAMLWNGTAASAVNLNPTALAGITQSVAIGTDGVHQVGAGYTSSSSGHAMLWSGTAASAVDLHPATGFVNTSAIAVSGGQEVGQGFVSSTSSPNALLWSGSAASMVSLQPTNIPGFVYSGAYGVANGQQVGAAFQEPTGDKPFNPVLSHAVLWTGTAASAVDLNPTTGGINSVATATNGSMQVGRFYSDPNESIPHAMMWTGTVASAVNLESLLPSTTAWANSRAASVDAAGNVFGTANTSTGTYAVEWLPTTIPMTSVSGGQTYQFPTDAKVQAVAGMTVAGGGKASVATAANSSSRQLAVVAGNGLSLGGTTGAWTGTLDLANNDLDLPGASLATVTNQVAQGYAGGNWNGSGGITSSTAAADASHLTAIGVIQNVTAAGTALYSTFDGQAVTTSDVLAKYTLYGDTNLDGVVDVADYTRIDAGYLGHLSGWANGDFNYDGVVNGTDYTLMDNAFNLQAGSATASAMFVHPLAEVAAVPEPASAIVFALGFGLVGRRRRSKRA